MDSHMTTHSIDSSVTTGVTVYEEGISSGTILNKMMISGSEPPVETPPSNGAPGGPSGGMSNELSVQDTVAAVTVGLSSITTTTNAMTNTKMETMTDVPAEPTHLSKAPSKSSTRASATSAVVTTAGILPVSHAAIAAASNRVSCEVTGELDEGESKSSGQQGPKKMPMALVNELAKYNKVKAIYVLEDEAGPAHKKTFYIRLEVGEENFHAHGPSIRKAQHAAAEVALQRSVLQRPPQRPAHSYSALRRPGSGDQRPGSAGGGGYQPVVELNALASRRGEEIVYTAMDPPPPHHPATHGYPPAMTGSGPPPAPGFRSHIPAWGCGPPMTAPMPPPPPAASTYPYGIPPGQTPAMHMYPGRFPSFPYYPGAGGMSGYPRRFTVLLKVGPREFQGEGVTRQAARNNAANKALRLLRYMPMPTQTLERQREGGEHPYEHQNEGKPKRSSSKGEGAIADDRADGDAAENNADEKDNEVSDQESDDESSSNMFGEQQSVVTTGGARKKSDISIVHEVGLKLRQHATFDMVKEAGPAHSKIFTYRCKLGHREAEGDGNSKKRAKLYAAKAMLDKLKVEFSETGRDYIISMCSEVASQRVDATGEPMKKMNQTRKKNRNLIKEQKTDPDYGQQVNPVSRLIQVQQGRKEADPIFEMVSERGMNKRKEFIYRCSVGNHNTEGIGQNKRLAKRQAAEHMLDSLGFKRIEKFPIKSVLKNCHNGGPPISPPEITPQETSPMPSAPISTPHPNPGPSPSSQRHPQPPPAPPANVPPRATNSTMKNRPSFFTPPISNGKRMSSHMESQMPFQSPTSHSPGQGSGKKNVSFSMAPGILYVAERSPSHRQQQQNPGSNHFSQQTNNNRMVSSPSSSSAFLPNPHPLNTNIRLHTTPTESRNNFQAPAWPSLASMDLRNDNPISSATTTQHMFAPSGPRVSNSGGPSPQDFLHRASTHGSGSPNLDPFSRANMMMSPPQPPPQIAPQPPPVTSSMNRGHTIYDPEYLRTSQNLYTTPESLHRAEVQLNYLCETMGYKCQFADQPKGSQQGIAKSEYFSTLTLSPTPGQQTIFSGTGGSIQEAHDAAAEACLQEFTQIKQTYHDPISMHINQMMNPQSHAEMLGGPPL